MPEAKTTIERLNERPEILEGMLQMPRHMNEEMVESRREEVFDFLWTTLTLDKHEMLENIKDRENQLLESDVFDVAEAEELPEWLCRMEAQDMILEMLHEQYEAEF